MEGSTFISFCLPNDIDEGICPLAFIQYLVEKHNELVHMVDEVLLKRAKRSHREEFRAKSISARFFTSAHCFCFDSADFLSFVEKKCVTTTGTGYDFAKAEARLVGELAGLPHIEHKQENFNYNREHATLATLEEKLPQVELAPDVVDAVRREVNSSALASRIMETVEIVIDFLISTGGSSMKTFKADLVDMRLSHYIKTVLLEDEELGSRIVSQQVRYQCPSIIPAHNSDCF